MPCLHIQPALAPVVKRTKFTPHDGEVVCDTLADHRPCEAVSGDGGLTIRGSRLPNMFYWIVRHSSEIQALSAIAIAVFTIVLIAFSRLRGLATHPRMPSNL